MDKGKPPTSHHSSLLYWALLFRPGFTGETEVFAAVAAPYAAGVTGMYMLLLGSSEMEILAGSISFTSFTSFTPVLSWAATGAMDVPATALSICSLSRSGQEKQS